MNSVRYAFYASNEVNEITGDPLWWSNTDGWGNISEATLFTEREMKHYIDIEHCPRINGEQASFTQIDCEVPDV